MTFCPQALDYGNVADWLAGFGALATVAVALYFSIKERIRLRQDKHAEEIREAEMENAFLVEALQLYRNIKSSTVDLIDQIQAGEVSFDNWEYQMKIARETALRYQQMPKINLRAYREMDAVIDLSRHKHTIKGTDMGDIEQLMKSVVYRCESASKSIVQSPNTHAPLNW